MIKNKFIYTSILFVFISIAAYCQQNKYIFEHIGITDGLPQSTIYSMIQDNYGFLWFGTQDKGLCKYDGYSFKIYNHNPFNSNSISSNKVSKILQDSDGIIWIGTWGGGLNKFDPKTERFITYKNDPADPNTISNNKAQTLFIDKDSILWIGTAGGGLSSFDKVKGIFTNYRHSVSNINSLSNDRVWSICQDLSGFLWIGTDNGMGKLNLQTGMFENYFHDENNSNSISDNQVRQVYVDKKGILWIGTAIGLDRYLPESNSFRHYSYKVKYDSKNSVNVISEDKLDNFWIGTHIGGLKLFNREKGTFQSFINDPENSNTISYNDIRDIILDNTHILWIATRGGGLNKLDLKPAKFEYYTHDPINRNSLLNSRVKSIYEDKKGILWIGTDIGGGLNKFDRKKNKFTFYTHDKNNANSLINNDITVIEEDRNGYLWLGTDGYGMDRFNPEEEKFTHFRFDPNNSNSLCFNEIVDIQEDKNGFIWIGTNSGLDKYDPLNNEFIHYKSNKKDSTSLSNNIIWAIYPDSKNRLWIGTDYGLNLYDEKTNSFKHFIFHPEDSNGLTSSTIYSIYEDQNNILWIGTENGLHSYNPDNESFAFYKENVKTVNYAIFGILDDDNNNLWLSTVNGLTRFNVLTQEFRNYDIYDGLQNNDFSIGACTKSYTGELIFGGVNGFNIFNPDSVKDNPFVPPVVINEFKLFNKTLKPGTKKMRESVYVTNELKLKYNENIFSFSFSALNYTKNKKNQYSCKLEGFDEDWIYMGTNHEKQYTNIPPGQYVFKVRGSNNDGVWNNTGADLNIIITPPFWKTRWFIVIELGLLILLIISIIRWKVKSLILSKKELEEIVRARTLELSDQKEELESALTLISNQKDGLKEANIKIQENAKLKEEFLANTSHELRTPLNVIVGFSNLLLNEKLTEKQQSYLREIKNSTENLLVVIEDILTFSKIESGKLNIEKIEFEFKSTIQSLFRSFSLKANEKNIDITLNYDAKIPRYLVGDPIRLNQIISNLLDNAIKFTNEGGKVKLDVSLLYNKFKSAEIEFVISDTGIGMDLTIYKSIFSSFSQARADTTRKFGGTGLGLSIVKRLVDAQKGKITVDSKPDKGTIFNIVIEFEIGTGEKAEKNVTNYIIDKSEKKNELYFLLVEDNPANIILTIDTIKLHNSSIKIDTAENGKIALDLIEKNDYDIVILDIQMPVMNGYETAKYIRNNLPKPKSEIPILGMSAHALQEEKNKCFELGMNEYISKPFVPDELFNKIELLVHSQKPFINIKQDKIETMKFELINLTNLRNIYGDKDDKIENILNICLENIPKQLIDLRQMLKNKNFKDIRTIAHSLKTSLDYLGLEQLKENSLHIEISAAENRVNDEMYEKLDEINDKWKFVEKELVEYFKNK
ncbi:MAG: response regulator [Chlorobi bacterium]|nr:response regulator [Chlorobiota bacterium]